MKLFEFAPEAYYLNDLKGDFVDGNKAIPADQKKELLAEKREELKNYPTLSEAVDIITEKELALKSLVEEAEKKLVDLSDEKKLKFAEAYYSLGVVAWNKSYQTPVDDDIFPKEDRKKAIDTGFAALEKAIWLINSLISSAVIPIP